MPHLLQFLVLAMAGWLNRRQEDLIEYLREENRVLREQLGSRPLRLTNPQRRRLAVRGQKLGRFVLAQVAGIVTPETTLRWYRRLIARKYDGSARRRQGRPMTPREISKLVVSLNRVVVLGESHLHLLVQESSRIATGSETTRGSTTSCCNGRRH